MEISCICALRGFIQTKFWSWGSVELALLKKEKTIFDTPCFHIYPGSKSLVENDGEIKKEPRNVFVMYYVYGASGPSPLYDTY